MLHGFLELAALVALLAVPCLLALAIFADIAIDQTEQSVRRVWSRWRSRREAAKLERRAGIKPEHRGLLRHQWTRVYLGSEDDSVLAALPPRDRETLVAVDEGGVLRFDIGTTPRR